MGEKIELIVKTFFVSGNVTQKLVSERNQKGNY
jgi:hypothetical protein